MARNALFRVGESRGESLFVGNGVIAVQSSRSFMYLASFQNPARLPLDAATSRPREWLA